jgi:protein phosphatase
MPLKSGGLDAYGATHIGKVRTVNEDQFLIASLMKLVEIEQTSLQDSDLGQLTGPGRAALLMVADGVGGLQAGEKASETALENVARYVTQAMRCYYTVDEAAEERFIEELRTAVMRTHEDVQQAGEAHPGQEGMATTLTLVKVVNRRAYVVQVGDSRCYLFRDGELSQITRDQTIAQDLVDQGVMSAVTAEHSPFSHILSSAIGGTASPEVYTLDLHTGDVLLLSTDGLTKHVSNVELREQLGSPDSAEAICNRLVQMALDDGGSDNVTVVVARVLEPPVED